MLRCILILLFVDVISSQTLVVSYTNKTSETLPCSISQATLIATWRDDTVVADLYTYNVNSPSVETREPEVKHDNFHYSLTPNSDFSLIISDVEAEDEGDYQCSETTLSTTVTRYTLRVEVPGIVSIKNGSQDVNELTVIVGESYEVTCSATGARSNEELSLIWDPDLDGGNLDKQTADGLTNYTITATYAPEKEHTSIKCQLSGYVTQSEIQHRIEDTVSLIVLYKPECSLMVDAVNNECSMVTLTCDCTANPEKIMKYSFYNGGSLINDTVSNTIIVDVDYDTTSEFSCRASSNIGTGEMSNQETHSCKGTTALPTTTVTTEITSATPVPTATGTRMTTMFTTTAPPKPTTQGSSSTPDPDGLHIAVIIVIVLVCLALIVIVVIVVVKCVVGGHSTDSHKPGSPANEGGIVTPLSVSTTSSSAPLYGEVKKDKKKKSDETSIDLENKETSQPEYAVPNKKKSNKPDGNGAGPENDLPTYAAVDKPQPTAAPRTSQKGPEPDGMELQYADLDHTGKPATNEIRIPQDEPTEYATVQQSVIV